MRNKSTVSRIWGYLLMAVTSILFMASYEAKAIAPCITNITIHWSTAVNHTIIGNTNGVSDSSTLTIGGANLMSSGSVSNADGPVFSVTAKNPCQFQSGALWVATVSWICNPDGCTPVSPSYFTVSAPDYVSAGAFRIMGCATANCCLFPWASWTSCAPYNQCQVNPEFQIEGYPAILITLEIAMPLRPA